MKDKHIQRILQDPLVISAKMSFKKNKIMKMFIFIYKGNKGSLFLQWSREYL